MEEQKTIHLGGLVYRLEMTNPETGWHKVKNLNDTSFWIPDEILKEISHIQRGVEKIESLNERYSDRMDEFRRKIDSQRKSIEYYKSERDNYKRIANKQAKDWEKLMDEFQAYKDYSITYNNNVEENRKILELEIIELREDLDWAKKTTIKVIVGAGLLMVATLIALAI